MLIILTGGVIILIDTLENCSLKMCNDLFDFNPCSNKNWFANSLEQEEDKEPTLLSGLFYRSATLYHPQRRAILHLKTQKRKIKDKNKSKEDTPPFFDTSCFRSKTVQILLLSSGFSALGVNTPLYYLVNHLTSDGVRDRSLMLMMIYFAAAWTLGCCVSGALITSKTVEQRMGRQYLCQVCLVVCGLSILALTSVQVVNNHLISSRIIHIIDCNDPREWDQSDKFIHSADDWLFSRIINSCFIAELLWIRDVCLGLRHLQWRIQLHSQDVCLPEGESEELRPSLGIHPVLPSTAQHVWNTSDRIHQHWRRQQSWILLQRHLCPPGQCHSLSHWCSQEESEKEESIAEDEVKN